VYAEPSKTVCNHFLAWMNIPIINWGYLLILRVDSCIVWFILIRCTFTAFCYFRGAILIGPTAIFLDHWAWPSIEASLCPVAKWNQVYNRRFHLFSIYTGELNFGQTIWDKTQVLLGTYWGMHLGTHWEQRNKTNNPCPPPTHKKQKTGSFMRACWAFPLAAWNFYFQNCSSPFLAWANGRGRNLGYVLLFIKWSGWKSLPHKPLKPKWNKRVNVEPSHWLHKIFISKIVGRHFWPGLTFVSCIN
jgi:hypothetical protein